jgi:hypothetical protein
MATRSGATVDLRHERFDPRCRRYSSSAILISDLIKAFCRLWRQTAWRLNFNVEPEEEKGFSNIADEAAGNKIT